MSRADLIAIIAYQAESLALTSSAVNCGIVLYVWPDMTENLVWKGGA